jgi:hypothetical protein
MQWLRLAGPNLACASTRVPVDHENLPPDVQVVMPKGETNE